MTFLEFLGQATQKSFWKQHVFCFHGDVYPLLFFRHIVNLLKEKNVVSISSLTVCDIKQLYESLHQCFLGETFFYWLGNLGESVKSKKNESSLIDILSLYRGPHSIAFFVDKENSLSSTIRKRITIIDVPAKLSLDEAISIFRFFNIQLSHGKKIILNEVCRQCDGISLDDLCMMISYFSVVSSRLDETLSDYISNIIIPQRPLFLLSQSFFKKQREHFFKLWAECHNDYPIPFWISFWTEQIWQAHSVVSLLKEGNFAMAKRLSFRLPLSFIKYDWQMCSLPQLKRSYEMLYEIDYKFKRGSSFHALDFFYQSYFLNKI